MIISNTDKNTSDFARISGIKCSYQISVGNPFETSEVVEISC